MDKNKISNKEYQEINKVSKRTASSELSELSEKFFLLCKTGTHGAAISYQLCLKPNRTIIGQ